ncbi:basic blue protein-like [Gastrolobium bilobum]|uniref:basic blue protein-like n=1 Tax=Gastrolobium bilobum TaxID=150636 RepID=UPI002AB149CB|nr:basic blue protein-like [Gastrolobium bilobum]
MAQERDGAMFALVLIFCVLVLHSEMVHADTHIVGDGGGWSFNVGIWPKGKSFKAGDILVFKYNPFAHDVLVVNEAGYNTCDPFFGERLFFSGNDQIQLARGMNYFICGFPGHCLRGMKFAINAA